MYSIAGYGQMIKDADRMAAYLAALKQVIRPNSVVLDIGTGTGIFAMLACQLGARQVYAIEPSDAIQVAREIANENGYGDEICFIQDLSTHVTLPEPVDVMLSDLRGVLPLFQEHIPAIADARSRFLAPDGIQIPQRDRLWVSVVAAPKLYQEIISPWDEHPYGFTMQAAQKRLMQTWGKALITPEQLVVDPQCWSILDYTSVVEPNVHGQLSWIVAHPQQAHGLCLWFDTELYQDIGFSNAPGQPELIYGQAFLPWLTPIHLDVGDQITVNLQAKLMGDDYLWFWHTQVLAAGCADHWKANFSQSTFFGTLLSPQQLHKQSVHHVPHLNRTGEMDYWILSQMQSNQNLGAIADQLATTFSDRFATPAEALTYVGQLSLKYSQ
jgi:type I protein arginine methyltransferase